jgi:hypothetical protein
MAQINKVVPVTDDTVPAVNVSETTDTNKTLTLQNIQATLYYSLHIIIIIYTIANCIVLKKYNDILDKKFKSDNKPYDNYNKYNTMVIVPIVVVVLTIILSLVLLIHRWKNIVSEQVKKIIKVIRNFVLIPVIYILNLVVIIFLYLLLNDITLILNKEKNENILSVQFEKDMKDIENIYNTVRIISYIWYGSIVLYFLSYIPNIYKFFNKNKTDTKIDANVDTNAITKTDANAITKTDGK